MTVRVDRGRDRLVPKLPLNDRERHAALDRPRRVGVPQIVHPGALARHLGETVDGRLPGVAVERRRRHPHGCCSSAGDLGASSRRPCPVRRRQDRGRHAHPRRCGGSHRSAGRKADTASQPGHGHVIADTTGLQAALDGKQPAGSYAAGVHTHTAAQIADATTAGRALVTAADAMVARKLDTANTGID